VEGRGGEAFIDKEKGAGIEGQLVLGIKPVEDPLDSANAG